MSGIHRNAASGNRFGLIRSQQAEQKRKPRRHRNSQDKFRKNLELDSLENREMLAVDLVVGDLLFRGDLIQDAEVYRANSKPIEVGYNPLQGELFHPLITLTGDLSVDQSAGQFAFKGSGAFETQNGLMAFWQNDTIDTHAVADLEGAGISTGGPSFQFGGMTATATTISFDNPGGGDTTDAEIKLVGTGMITFGTESDGTKTESPLSLTYFSLIVNGPESGSATGFVAGTFYAAGTSWLLQNNTYVATIAGGVNTTSISGAASSTIRQDVIPANLQNKGLTVTGGEITALDSTLIGSITLAGCSGSINGTVSYSDSTLKFTGSGKLTVGIFNPLLDTLTFSVQQNAFTALQSSKVTLAPGWVTSIAQIGLDAAVLVIYGAGITFTFDLAGDFQLDTSTNVESFNITGRIGGTYSGNVASFSPSQNTKTLTLNLLNNGITIRQGTIQDYEFQVDGRLDLTDKFTVEARAVTVFHNVKDNSYGAFGTFYFVIDGFKEFNKSAGGSAIFREPNNNFIATLGQSKASPGLSWVNGELRRVDASISTKDGFFSMGGYSFRINDLGLIYTATEGVVSQDWGVYGNFSWNNRSSSLDDKSPLNFINSNQGKSIGINLGTRTSPGLLIQQKYDTSTSSWILDWKLQQSGFRLAGIMLGPLRISDAEVLFSYDTTNGLMMDRIALTFGFRGMMFGGSINFKDHPLTKDRVVDAFTVKAGVDPGASAIDGFTRKGLPIFPPYVYLMYAEGGVSNISDPSNLIININATFMVGDKVPLGWVGAQYTSVYSGIIVGNVSIYTGQQKITGSVNVYLGAYWDQANYAAKLNPWKPLLGSGTGNFNIDWSNGFDLKIDFNGTMIQLVTGQFQLRINNQGFVIYAMVRVKPTAYGIFDFVPLSWIDVSGSFLLLKTPDRFVAGAWVKLDFFLWRGNKGAMIDFLTGDIIVIGDSEINKLTKEKDAFFNAGTYTQPYTISVDQGTAGLNASAITATIPFSTAKVSPNGVSFSSALKSGDISLSVPSSGKDVNTLPAGTSYAYRVDFNDPDKNGYTTGSITVWVYANTVKDLDYTKTFASIGLSSLKVDVNVTLRQNSFLAYAGANTLSYLSEITRNTDKYLSGVDKWSKTKKVSVESTDYPVVPDLIQSLLIAKPAIAFKDEKLVSQEVNSFTNQSTFTIATNLSKNTIQNGYVSLLVLDEVQVLAYHWLVIQTGPWTQAATGYSEPWVADGSVVEQNTFNAFEIRDRLADDPLSSSNASVGQEVLYFDSAGSPQKGVIQSVFDTYAKVVNSAGNTSYPDYKKIKPMWLQKVKVKLSNAVKQSTGEGQVFTAANVSTGYVEPQTDGTGQNYFELFNTHSAIKLGQFNPETADALSPDWFKLPTLPHFVSDEISKAPTNPTDTYFPIDSTSGLTTMPAGQLLPMLAVNGQSVSDSGTLIGLQNLNLTATGATATVTWSEKGLTPTPKFAYLLVNDQVNPLAYSAFIKFTPSVSVTGRVLLDQGDTTKKPYAGLTVYFDTNGNGVYDSEEPWTDDNNNGVFDAGDSYVDANANGVRDTLDEPSTVTNTQGVYYFYDVNPGTYSIGFVLPDNKAPLSGSSVISVTRGTEVLTTVADFTVINVYPTLTGRLVVDANQNGVSDDDEKGMSNAYVIVTGANVLQVKTMTDADGYYSIPITDPVFGSSVTVSITGTGLDPNLSISTTDPAKASVKIDGLDYLKPMVFDTSFQVQSIYDFNYDSSQGIFQNITNYFQLFLDGRYSGVSIKTGGFEFNVDRFKLLPFSIDRQGIESATGRVVMAGQTLNFTLNGPEGLVSNGPKLQSLSLSLSGDFNLFGAKLKLDGLKIKYTGADETLGTPARFSLSGTSTLDVGGNWVSVSLPGDGLLLSDGGIESLNIKLLGGLKIGGETIDLGSLSAIYNKATDKLTLSGSTSLLTFGSEATGNYIGLENVVMQIGQTSTLDQARVLSLQATLSGGLSFDGAAFSVDQLIIQYSPESDQLNITGKSKLSIGESVLNLDLPTPGIQIVDGAVSLLASATGELKLNDYKFSLDSSSINYKDQSLWFNINGSFYVGKTQLAMGGGLVSWKDGALSQISGKVSGSIPLDTTSLDLQNLDASYIAADQSIKLQGSFQLSLIDNNKKTKALRVAGAIGLVQGEVTSVLGVVETGDWTLFEGFTVNLTSLNLAFKKIDSSYTLSGEANANLLGNAVGLSVMAPGLVWKNGSFSSFGGGITGSIPLSKDVNNKTVSDLYAKNLGFLYESDNGRLTLHGKLGVDFGSVGGGSLQTDEKGLVIDANGLQRFSLFVSAGLNFGESFEDTNADYIRQENEKYTDKNGNNKYDFGFGINISQVGFSYTPAFGSDPSELLLSGKGQLGFGPDLFGENTTVGATIDFTNPGIRITGGKVKDFSVGVAGNIGLNGLNFTAEAGMGARWISAKEELDLWGGLEVIVSGDKYVLNLGTNVTPGLSIIQGELTRFNAGISGNIDLGSVEFTLNNAGLSWNSLDQQWGIFGSLKINLGLWVEAGLGTQSLPGLLIDTSNPNDTQWNLSQLTLGFGGVNLGGVGIDEVKFAFSKIDNVVTVEASCGVNFNGWGLAGKLAFKNGVITQIFVQANTQINIPGTPVFINRLVGSIQNIDFDNLSSMTFTAMVGINVGGEVDLTGVPLLSGKYGLAQFNGSAIISAGGMTLQADAYVLAKETGLVGNSTWKGYLAQGTAGVTLNWADKKYFANLDLTLAVPVNPLFDARIKGVMSFDGQAMGFSFYASATLQIGKNIPLIGGLEIAGASFLIQVYPGNKLIDSMAWFTYRDPFDWFKQKNFGLQWDIWNNNWNILNDDEVQSRLKGRLGAASLKAATNQPSPMISLAASPSPAMMATSGLIQAAAVKSGYAYAGTSSPVPDTDVTGGLYTINFQVANPAARANAQTWFGKLNLQVDPVAGVSLETLAPSFDTATGQGSISVRLLPLAGQYLPRGLVFTSRLSSPVALVAPVLVAGQNTKQLQIDSSWTTAFEFGGTLPAVGTDAQTGLLIDGLNSTDATYTIQFTPVLADGQSLPADWLDSIRAYFPNVPGVLVQVGKASYDKNSQIGSIKIDLTPDGTSTFLSSGIEPQVVLRSKIELRGIAGEGLPNVSAQWSALPSEIDKPVIPAVFGTGLQTTKLTGRVNDPRLKQVSVALFYSTDEAGSKEHLATLADGNGAMDIPVMVGPDGNWSVDITWDPSQLPSGSLWLYGWVDESGPYQPVYGESANFTLQHDVEGTVLTPVAILANSVRADSPFSTRPPAITTPKPGVRVFADLNNNGLEDKGEPIAITGSDGKYFLDVPDHSRPVAIFIDTPFAFTPASGQLATRVVDLSKGPVQVNLNLVPTSTILSGRLKVAGDFGQSVGGVGVLATGPDGRIYRETTDIQGNFHIPIGTPGLYSVNLDGEKNLFYNFRVSPAPSNFPTTVNLQNQDPRIIHMGDIEVNTTGTVSVDGENAQRTLQTLVEQSNAGYVNSIGFDTTMKGKSLAVTGVTPALERPYMLWNSSTQSWTNIPARPPLGRDGQPDETYLYGRNGFVIQRNLNIDGGNLGITLQGDGSARAFLVRPGAVFGLANLTINGFGAQGANGQAGISGLAGGALGATGGQAGMGGAILNMGDTTIDNVVFAQNTARGGDGGSVSVPAPGIPTIENGSTNNGGSGGGPFGGAGGQAYPVTVNYSLVGDLSARTSQVVMAGAGGGGSGLGGAIYNVSSASVLSIKGNTRFVSNKAFEGKGGTAPDYVTNLANAIAGDEARTLSVSGFGESSLARGQNGQALGNAIFNNGGVLSFDGVPDSIVEAPAAITLSNLKIAENKAPGAVVGRLGTSAFATGTITYSLVQGPGGNDNPSFSIVNGQLTATRVFNYELQSNQSVRVRASGSNGIYTEQIFVISVIDRKEAAKTLITLPKQLTAQADATSPLVFPTAPFADLVAKASQLFTVTLRVRVGSLSALSTSDVAVSGTPNNLTFKGTLSALNAYFTSVGGRVHYTPLAHSTQSRLFQFRISKTLGGKTLMSTAQSRIHIATPLPSGRQQPFSLARNAIGAHGPMSSAHPSASTSLHVITSTKRRMLRHL
jgi:hypothetical protein